MTTTVATELRSLYDRNGRLTPEDVVDHARPKTSPLHARFEWDDKVAGEAYRREQAAHMIRSVKVTVIRDGHTEPTRVRAFLNIPTVAASEDDAEDTPAGNYVPQDIVSASPEMTRLALREMERRWRELRRAYQEHAEFWDLVRREAAEVA